MQELQNVVNLNSKYILNYFYCERRAENIVVVISEMITSGSLREYIRNFRHPKLSVCQTWLRLILTGLQTLHSKNVTHGHLTCGHIYINSNTGDLKIGDLSLVKLPEIIADRYVVHRQVDDIHQFGFIMLEIALAQFFNVEKSKTLIDKFYNALKLDINKIERYVNHINDSMYRELVMLCINAKHGVSASDLLKHQFFTKEYKRDEYLKRGKIHRTSKAIVTTPINNKLDIKVASSTLNDMRISSHIIDVTLKIICPTNTAVICFKYNLDTDNIKKLIEEMRIDINIPERYIQVIEPKFTFLSIKHLISSL